MSPTTSFWNNFSTEGRTKKLWATALNESDPEKSLALLRSVLDKISQPPAFAHLWLPFLDTFLASERVQLLNANDLANVQKMGTFLQQGSDLHDAPPASTIWQRLLEAYTRRGEDLLARSLAIKIYEDKSIDEQTRAYCVRTLAKQALIDDRYLDMYMAHLRLQPSPQAETEIFHALDLLFTIDFNAPNARIQSTHRVAQFLLALKLPPSQTLPGHIWIAEGIYALTYKAAPQEARELFTRACQLPGEKLLASLGLLACALRQGEESEFTRLAESAEVLELAQVPEIAALLDLHRMIQWLTQPEKPAPIPPAIGNLALLDTRPLHRLAGDKAKFALGYSYLLRGEADLARSQFDALAKSGWSQPEWGYFAAWAFALCGEGERVADCFRQLINWSGRWTIACLLLDLNPRLAEQAGAVAFLKNLAATAGSMATIAQTRLTLAQMGKQISGKLPLETAVSLPEKVEILRTDLARQKLVMAAHLRQPLFARLPLADQTFWLGLAERETSKRLSLLQQAADNWHYQRAALYLLVSALRRGDWKQANNYLEQALAGRTDLRVQLIQIYIEGYKKRDDETIQHCEQLIALGEARAGYILGHLYFYKAAVQPDLAWQAHLQAALAWQRLLETTTVETPEDLVALAACAAFIAYPQQRASNAHILIACFQELDSAFHQSWLEWHVALALLWYGTPQAFNDAYPLLLRVTELASRANDLTITALIQALAGFSHRLHDGASRQHLLELLERLTSVNQGITSHPRIFSALILAQRSLYLTAGQEERARIEASASRYLARTPNSELLLLWLTYLALYNHRSEEALALLHDIHLDNQATDHFVHSLSDLLNNTHFASTNSPGDTLVSQISRDALRVARAITSGRIAEGYTLLLQQSDSSVLGTWQVEHILPPLCRYLHQENITPPAFLTSTLYNQRLLTLDSAEMVNLAWCAFFLGDREQACRFWEAALLKSADDARHKGWRQDFVHFLCRLAVSDFNANQYLSAANQLKRAARWTEDDFAPQLSQALLLERARALETRALSMLLLTYQFPDFDSAAFNPGRYHVLGLTILQDPQLCAALISRDRERIQKEWDRTLQAQQNNIRFLHALSLIYREIALSKQQQLIDTEKDWFTSTAFWILLLSTQAFWQYFTTDRHSEGQSKPGKLSTQQQEELWQDALENILVFHSTIARKSLAAGQHTQARMHARCLALGRQSKDALLAQLQTANLSFPAPIDQQRLDQIKDRTQSLLNEWGQSLIGEAEKSTSDARRIQELPAGIRKNYAGGISILEPFIRLDVPLVRVLLVCLEWYNEWCNDLRVKGAWAQYKEKVEAAAQICSRLQRRCNRKNIYNAENKAIARSLVQRGLSLEESEPTQALHSFEEAQAWGSDHPDLPDLLERTRIASTEEAVRVYANNQQFEEAYQLISQAESLLIRPESLRNLRMRISFRQARELADQGKYTEAWSRSKQALALGEDNTILQKFVHEMEELLPEESHAQSLHAAETALAAQDFTQVHQQLARIAPGSRFFQQAQEIRNQTLLLQQEQAAKQKEAQEEEAPETLEEKERRWRSVLENGEPGQSRARAREELSIILASRAANELDEANKLNETSDMLRRSRFIYTRALLDESLELDARNQSAKQLLIKLNALTEKKGAEKKQGGKS